MGVWRFPEHGKAESLEGPEAEEDVSVAYVSDGSWYYKIHAT